MMIESFVTVTGSASVLARFNVKFASGLIVRDLRLMNGKNGRWIAWPSRPYKDKDGKDKYFDYIIFDPKEKKDALEKEIKQKAEAMLPQTEQETMTDIPF